MKQSSLMVMLIGLSLHLYGAARSVKIIFKNQTRYNLVVLRPADLPHGMWTRPTPSQMYSYKDYEWSSESKGFLTGTEGEVSYVLYGMDCAELVEGTIILHWDNPYSGKNEFKALELPNGFEIFISGNEDKRNKHPIVTWTLQQKGMPNYINPIILPDDPITSLVLRLKTADKWRAGTDDDVYFSIGPYSWQLDNNYNERGSGDTDTYDLRFFPVDLRASDIMMIHIEKKGQNGRYGFSDFPDGGWYPESVELFYNNNSLSSQKIGTWLETPSHPFWTKMVQQCQFIPFENRFVNSLRLLPNEPVPSGRGLAEITTSLFKEGGISGWLNLGGCDAEGVDASVTAKGRVYRKPVLSADGFATIDIEIIEVQICGHKHKVSDFEKFGRHRYIRFEYKVDMTGSIIIPDMALDVLADYLIRTGVLPGEGCVVSGTGPLKWDTDNEGWFEIHPTSLTISEC